MDKGFELMYRKVNPVSYCILFFRNPYSVGFLHSLFVFMSQLEIYKSTTADQIIVEKENWWKEILQS